MASSLSVVTELANRLHTARLHAGTSREAAALAIDRSGMTITAYERGRAVPPLRTLERLARYYGVSVAELLREDDES